MKTKILISILVGLLVIPFVSAVLAIPANDNAGGPERVPVLIGFSQTPGRSEQALVRGHGGVIKYSYHLVPAIAAWLPEPAIEALQKNPNVTTIEPDIKVYAVDAELDASWGVKRIGAGIVHDDDNKGTGISVAIIDTGIEKDYYPDLYVAGGVNYVPKKTGPPWKRVPDPEDWDDDNGHGTHCAGIVAALDNDTGVVGVAPEADLYALKVLGGDNSGALSYVIAALEWATDNGIQVTNNSYGTGDDPGDLFKEAFDNSAAEGIIHVCAAGNYGSQGVIYPALYDSCIAVAATDNTDTIASFSSIGEEVEISAPGVSIYSTVPGGYGYKSGTSMASPHVAGVVALMIANGGYSRDTLVSTADDLGEPGRDPKYGYGLVNAAAAAGVSVTTGTIAGTVTNFSDSTAIEGATVSVDTGQSATTAGDGTYTITDVPTGDRSVTASADGFESQITTATVTENLTITVYFVLNPVTTTGTVSVASIDYATEGGKNKDKHLLIIVALEDDLGSPVVSASVSIETYLDGSPYASATGTTGTDGTVTFRAPNAPSGTYTTEVTNVTAAGLIWDGSTPPNGFTK